MTMARPDGRFGRGHRHDEEHDDLPVDGCRRYRSDRDERQVDRVQHDLDREQDRDQVAPQEHARRADGKQHGRQHQIRVEGRFRQHATPFLSAPG